MGACSLLTAGLSYTCGGVLLAGTDDRLLLGNLEEISTITYNGSNANLVNGITMKTGKQMWAFQGNRQSNVGDSKLDVKKYFKGFQHLINFITFTKDPTTKLQLTKLTNAVVFAILQYKDTGTAGNTKYEIFGINNGLELTTEERKSDDTDTGGAYQLQLGNVLQIPEPDRPKTLWTTDLATTDAIITALLSPA